MNKSDLIFQYAHELRNQWPQPLACQWHSEYPQVFDEDDLSITQTGRQRLLHFKEWFVAVTLYRELGALSLVEKYLHTKHRHARKAEILGNQLSATELAILRQMFQPLGPKGSVQAPDLFVYLPGGRFWFVEVKGRREEISLRQSMSHVAIKQQLGVEVQIARVYPLPPV